MTRHFGFLIPSTNTTVEIECRLLPMKYQAHIGRLLTSSPGHTFSSPRDEDVDYQARLLGTAKVELVILAQTSASLFVDDYDEVVSRRMSAGAGVPAITSAQAIGRAVRALGLRRIALVSPYTETVNQRAARFLPASTASKPWHSKALAPPIPMRSAISARRTRATLLPASIGRRSRPLLSPAAISRRWRRSPAGNANSRNRSSPPTKPRSGPC